MSVNLLILEKIIDKVENDGVSRTKTELYAAVISNYLRQFNVGIGAPLLQTVPRDSMTMAIKAVSPDEMLTEKSKLVLELTEKIGKKLREEEDNDEQYYHIVIDGEYPRPVLDEIEKIYLACGWARAICKISGETGERPGLTGLQLWRQ